MSNLTGTFVEVEFDANVEKRAGGTYNGFRVTYKDNKGEYQTMVKTMKTLEVTPGLRAGLDSLKAGEAFTIERKRDGDFLNPTKAYVGQPVGGSEPAPAKVYTPGPKTASEQGMMPVAKTNTFEVNNELKEKQMKIDELKQPLIIRQVCLKAAAELADILKIKNEADLLAMSERLVAYVRTGATGSIEDMMNDDIGIK